MGDGGDLAATTCAATTSFMRLVLCFLRFFFLFLVFSCVFLLRVFCVFSFDSLDRPSSTTSSAATTPHVVRIGSTQQLRHPRPLIPAMPFRRAGICGCRRCIMPPAGRQLILRVQRGDYFHRLAPAAAARIFRSNIKQPHDPGEGGTGEGYVSAWVPQRFQIAPAGRSRTRR